MTATGPIEIDVDPFGQDAVADPDAVDAAVREAGPVIRLSRYGVWATGRHELISHVLHDPASFSSAGGNGVMDIRRAPQYRSPSPILEADPPTHTVARRVMNQVLQPRAIASLAEVLAATAERVVGAAVEKGTFDAVADLAETYSLAVFPDAVGIPRDGHEYLLPWGDLVFHSMGPRNEFYDAAVARSAGAVERIARYLDRGSLAPLGFGGRIYEFADSGEISEEEAGLLVRALLSAGLDTTILAIGTAIWQLAGRPEQWAALHNHPALARTAFEETLRYWSPAPYIGRAITEEVELGGVRLDAGDRIVLFLASANRDPRRWSEPDVFDLTHNVAGHLAFGVGVHNCVGQVIARMEAEALLGALARRVGSLEVAGDPVPRRSNWLRGFQSAPVRVVAA